MLSSLCMRSYAQTVLKNAPWTLHPTYGRCAPKSGDSYRAQRGRAYR